jgi:deoxyribodipyrimidine photo-lyase
MMTKAITELSTDPRITIRRAGPIHDEGVCVIYWMQRSQRALDNAALDLAVKVGNELSKPVVVFLAPVPFYPRANLRHYTFLNQGLPQLASDLRKRNIGFVLRRYPDHRLPEFCTEVPPCLVIGDENPMREPEHWRELATKQLRVPLWTVDSDVIIPSRLLEKQQFAAYTIRPRIKGLLPKFLVPLGNLRANHSWKIPSKLRTLSPQTDITEGWKMDRSVAPVAGFRGGTHEALKLLTEFIEQKLTDYSRRRNHPESDGTSRLSPYLHFGQIGPHTIALKVLAANVTEEIREAFLEELIVRRELAINFVRFNPDYDSIDSAPNWAKATLAEHARDERPVLYTEQQLEDAATHDPLWNAAQKQMLHAGWMHNYMRMYWAKKILEWSPSPSVAYQIAIKLNDKYFLDGRDPNGYEGIAWAIAGKSDRAWFDRPIFGKVRYMSFNSTSRKFDSRKYIQQMDQLESEVQPKLF